MKIFNTHFLNNRFFSQYRLENSNTKTFPSLKQEQNYAKNITPNYKGVFINFNGLKKITPQIGEKIISEYKNGKNIEQIFGIYVCFLQTDVLFLNKHILLIIIK